MKAAKASSSNAYSAGRLSCVFSVMAFLKVVDGYWG